MVNSLVENMLLAALYDCCAPSVANEIKSHVEFSKLINTAANDLIAFSNKDPASRRNVELVARGYTSYKAVLHYRLAHWIAKTFAVRAGGQPDEIAMVISSRGKLQSGAEIHHRCEIGERFVLDHGYGTVIGETAHIGDDCYILNGVTLGATGIAANPEGKRHPTVGSRVEIGAFARVYGAVTIGDDVFIGPHTLIKDDIPTGSIVTTKAETLIMRSRVVKAV